MSVPFLEEPSAPRTVPGWHGHSGTVCIAAVSPYINVYFFFFGKVSKVEIINYSTLCI